MLHTISTGLTAAAVHFLLTVGARVADRAGAAVASAALFGARPAVEARLVCAQHSAHLTVLAIEALRAAA